MAWIRGASGQHQKEVPLPRRKTTVLAEHGDLPVRALCDRNAPNPFAVKVQRSQNQLLSRWYVLTLSSTNTRRVVLRGSESTINFRIHVPNPAVIHRPNIFVETHTGGTVYLFGRGGTEGNTLVPIDPPIGRHLLIHPVICTRALGERG